MAARGVYRESGGFLQAAPAPRFSATPASAPGPVPRRGGDAEAILRDWS
jgi:acetyl-CoA hydrolase